MISQLHYEECGCTECIFLRNDQIAKLEARLMEVTERLHGTQDRHAQWQNHANELERLLRTAVFCHSSYCGCQACEYLRNKND